MTANKLTRDHLPLKRLADEYCLSDGSAITHAALRRAALRYVTSGGRIGLRTIKPDRDRFATPTDLERYYRPSGRQLVKKSP